MDYASAGIGADVGAQEYGKGIDEGNANADREQSHDTYPGFVGGDVLCAGEIEHVDGFAEEPDDGERGDEFENAEECGRDKHVPVWAYVAEETLEAGASEGFVGLGFCCVHEGRV